MKFVSTLLFGLAALSFSASAAPDTCAYKRTELVIVNNLDQPMVLQLKDVRAGDWCGVYRPDMQFSDQIIMPR